METLTKALSCDDSTLLSLLDAIARVKQMQAVKLLPSIPKEVVTNGRGAMDAAAAAAAAAKSMADDIETSNLFEALHYLGKTC
jgi:hypothetical protein